MKTQLQLFREAEQLCFRLNEAMLDAIREGMTRDELQSLINRRPEVYGMFSGFLGKLPCATTKA